jgi:4-amino-4-deoxy-L-arabinose transferase-like glycosyltransferase
VAERLRPPPALGALLAVSLLLAVTWAAVLPAFQAPDEQSHFNYVQSLGARHKLPGDPDRPFFSTQASKGIAAVNSDQVAGQLQVKPEWSGQLAARWAAADKGYSRTDGGGRGPAYDYPPAAYMWEALGYAAASGGDLFDELLGARLMSALWVPVSVLAAWLLAGEILGRRRVLQTAVAAVPALAPMFVFISSSVSPDGMLYAVWTLALWMGVRAVRRRVPIADAAVFFALVGLACTVNATSYALLVPAAFVGVYGLAARWPWRAGRVLKLVAAAAIPIALTLGVWVVVARTTDHPAAAQVSAAAVAGTSSGGGTAGAAPTSGGTNWRELSSYLWQYYLPRLPFQKDFQMPFAGYPLLQVWITQGWAAFGWLEVKFPPWVYRVLGVLTVAIFAGGLAALVRARRRVDWRVLTFLALACLALLAGLHWTDYHQVLAGSAGFMQGRYVFPVIGVIALALGGAVSLLPAARQRLATGAAIAGLFIFHLFSLGLVLERFYA